jgi:hypothetical protein
LTAEDGQQLTAGRTREYNDSNVSNDPH